MPHEVEPHSRWGGGIEHPHFGSGRSIEQADADFLETHHFARVVVLKPDVAGLGALRIAFGLGPQTPGWNIFAF
jgi:hypothetical protein